MTPSKLKPFYAYIEYAQYGLLKRFAAKNKMPMTQVIREAISAKIAGDKYATAYNAGLKAAIVAVQQNKAAKMRFPSGKSFAELVVDDVNKLFLKESEDEQEVHHEPRTDAGSSDHEEFSDPSLGC
jgi:hypothetical protein